MERTTQVNQTVKSLIQALAGERLGELGEISWVKIDHNDAGGKCVESQGVTVDKVLASSKTEYIHVILHLSIAIYREFNGMKSIY
jgi:uncharacterized protein involved in tellurium resistance